MLIFCTDVTLLTRCRPLSLDLRREHGSLWSTPVTTPDVSGMARNLPSVSSERFVYATTLASLARQPVAAYDAAVNLPCVIKAIPSSHAFVDRLRALAVGGAFLLLGACVSADVASPAPSSLADVERCRAAGHVPDSEGYAGCLQAMEMLRRQQQLREQAISNAAINAQRRAPAISRP